MNKIYKSVLIGALASIFVAGCASKTETEGTSYSDQQPVAVEKVDNNVDKLGSGDEQVVEVAFDETTSNSNDSLLAADQEVENSLTNGINAVKSDIDGNVVVLKSVHFAFDKFNLTDDMRQIATANYSKIDSIIQNYNNLEIKLEGNCDEWGTDEYNYALGLKRAKTAKDALVADGISEDKIIMVSFGESNPVCKERNVECWKTNRRVDYRLLP